MSLKQSLEAKNVSELVEFLLGENVINDEIALQFRGILPALKRRVYPSFAFHYNF